MRNLRTGILASLTVAAALAVAPMQPASATIIIITPPPAAAGAASGGSSFGAGGYAAVGIIVIAGALCIYDFGEKLAGRKPWAPPPDSYYWKR